MSKKIFLRRLSAASDDTMSPSVAKRAVLLAVPLFLLLVLIWASVLVAVQREGWRAQENALFSVEAQAKTLTQEVLRKIGIVDVVARFVQQGYESAPDKFDVKRDVPASLFSSSSVLQTTIVDADARTLQSNFPNDKGVDLSDRPHFLVHKWDAHVGLYISEPVIGRVSHKRSIQVTRRLSRPDGSFAGVVVVSVNPDFFTEGFDNRSELGTDGFAAVRSTQGYDISVNNGDGPADLIGNEQDWRKKYFVATMLVPGYPVSVTVARSRAVAMAAYEREKSIYLATATAISVLLIAFYVAILVMQMRLIALAETDALTGLPNRLKATMMVAELMNKNSALGHVALLYVDLDRFSLINDRLGHEAGDRAIKFVAKRLDDCVSGSGRIARMGGDEFLIIIEAEDIATASEAMAWKVAETLRQPVGLFGDTYFLEGSVGIAIFDNPRDRARDLVANADYAMYVAKKSASNKIPVRRQFYTSELAAARRQKSIFDHEIHRALAEREFFLIYQPVVDVASGEVVLWEALVRWRHPTRGILEPIAFMSGTEATGMIVELSDYIVGEVFKQIAMFVKAGQRTPISTYLSPVYLATGYVGNGITNSIKKFDIPADMLQIEISERAISESFDKVVAQIDQLRRLSVKVVLSGFGVGSSSLVHLWQIPNDGVKVDESVIQSLAADPKVERMLSGLVTMAQGAQRVIVEGVQTQEQASWLQRFPGIRAQGPYFSAAVGEPAIETGGTDGEQ